MNSLDILVQTYIASIRTAPLTEWMYLLSALFDVTYSSVLVVFCISALVYYIRGKRYGLLFLSSITMTALITFVMKSLFDIARPGQGVTSAFGSSFPSYHAAVATVFFVMLMYIFDDYFSRLWRILFNALCVLSLFLVAFSRVYLGVHWVSDVVGGIILGGVLSYGLISGFRKFWK